MAQFGFTCFFLDYIETTVSFVKETLVVGSSLKMFSHSLSQCLKNLAQHQHRFAEQQNMNEEDGRKLDSLLKIFSPLTK